jgi:hypothetical protein
MSEPIFDFSWVEERTAVVDQAMRTYDPAQNLLLSMRWRGEYEIRLLPCSSPDWMVPLGEHRSVLPETDEGYSYSVPCPKTLYGDECIICNAINWGITMGKLSRKSEIIAGDKEGKGGIKLRTYGLVRALLVKYTKDEGEKKPPDFGSLPALKIIKVPGMLVQSFNEWLKDRDNFGPDQLLDWDTGHNILISGKPTNKFYWDAKPLLKPYPIPEEFRNVDSWPDIKEFLPRSMNDDQLPFSNQDLMELIDKHQATIPDFLYDFAHTISISGGSSVKALPGGKKKDELKKALNHA